MYRKVRSMIEISFVLNLSRQYWFACTKKQRNLIGTLGEFINTIMLDYVKKFSFSLRIRHCCRGGGAIARAATYYEPFAVCNTYQLSYTPNKTTYNMQPKQLRCGLLIENGYHTLPPNLIEYINNLLDGINENHQLIQNQLHEVATLFNFLNELKKSENVENIKYKTNLTNDDDLKEVWMDNKWNQILNHFEEYKDVSFFESNFYRIKKYCGSEYVLVTPGINIHRWEDYSDTKLKKIRKSLKKRISQELELAQTPVYQDYHFNHSHSINSYSLYIPSKSDLKQYNKITTNTPKPTKTTKTTRKTPKPSRKPTKTTKTTPKTTKPTPKPSPKTTKTTPKTTPKTPKIFGVYQYSVKEDIRNFYTSCVLTPKWNEHNQIIGYCRMKFFDKFMEYIWNHVSTNGQPLLSFLCSGIRLQTWKFKFTYKKYIIEIIELVKFVEKYHMKNNRINFKFKGCNFFALNSYNVPEGMLGGTGLAFHYDNIYCFEPEVITVKIGDGTDLHFDSHLPGHNSHNSTIAIPLGHGYICVFESYVYIDHVTFILIMLRLY